MVDECSNEETGVGPSMAIGSQYPVTVKADLPKTDTISSQPLQLKTINMIPRSPKRLYKTAATDALTPSLRLVNPISNKDIKPTPSQPRIKNKLMENNKNIIIMMNTTINIRKELSTLYHRLNEKTEPTTNSSIITIILRPREIFIYIIQ